tara:strand:+ start:103 stop:300 length:198 start_codon:yes stop_codon:yes gene_type:complete
MQVLFVRIPESTKKLLLSEIHAGRYRNQAEAANALIRAGLDSLTQHKKPNLNNTIEDMLRQGGGI